MHWDEMVTVGRIARTHGNRGQVIVNPDTDFPDARFQPGGTLYMTRGGQPEAVVLTAVRFQQGRPIIGIAGVDSMTDAAALAGLELRVPAEMLHPLPEAVFYRHDLVDCAVRTADGRTIGTVVRIEGPFEGGWLVVQGASGEVLIPLAAEICVRIAPDERMIVVDPPEGLLDVNL